MSKYIQFNILFLIVFTFIGNDLFSQDFLMADGANVVTCNGTFFDSGGNQLYGPNENSTMTICSDGNIGTHISLNFNGAVLGEGDNLCFFDGPDDTAPFLSCSEDFGNGNPYIIQATAANASGCITVTFTSDAVDEGEGWAASISCLAACQTIISDLVSTDPPTETAANGTDYINICPGDRIWFTGSGIYPQDGLVYNHSNATSDFFWNFGDGFTAVGPMVAHTYDEPGGYIVELTITDQFDCKNTNFITQRVRVSPIPNFVTGVEPPNEICFGDTINISGTSEMAEFDQHNFGVSSTDISFQTELTLADTLALPDGTGISYSSCISFNNFSPGQILTNINDLISICANMEHSYLRDLEIHIICPDGTSVQLQNQIIGGSGTHLGIPVDNAPIDNNTVPGIGYDYCWTPDAPNPDWLTYLDANPNTNTLPPDDYSSFESLEELVGCPLNGEWCIRIQDNWGLDDGYIFNWSIGFAEHVYPDIEVFEPQFINSGFYDNPTIIYNEQDSMSATPNSGTASYTFYAENDFGCTFDTTYFLTVLPPTHPDCNTCISYYEPAQDTLICEGEIVEFDVVGENEVQQNVTFEAIPQYEFGNPNHPPANPYLSRIEVNSVAPAMIQNPIDEIVSVCVDLETNWDGDIQIVLVSPNGVQLELSTNNGGNGDNYTNTCFTPLSVTPITSGTAPFTGDFSPEGDWNNLVGEPTNGEWNLRVSDSAGPQLGILNSWSITFSSTNEVQYTWSPSTGLSCSDCPNPEANPSTTTTYDISVSDSYGCIETDQVTVTVNAHISVLSVVCTPNIENGSFEITWDPLVDITDYEINIDGQGWIAVSGNTYTATGYSINDEINYEVRPVDSNEECGIQSTIGNCSLLLACTVEMVVDSQNSTSLLSCFGDCDGVINVIPSGAFGSYQITLTNQSTGDQTTIINETQFTNLCAGTYNLIIEDEIDNCSFEINNYVISDPRSLQILSFEPNNPTCYGDVDGSIAVTTSGGTGTLNYQWDDPNQQISSIATSLPVGTYSVVISDEEGCSTMASQVLTEPDPLSYTAQLTHVQCAGENTGAINFTINGGTLQYTIIFDDPSVEINALTNGVYTGTISDQNNCQINFSEEITAPAEALSIQLIQDVIPCFGSLASASAIVMGGTGTIDYNWDDNSSLPTNSALSAGNHNVTVTDEFGCESIGNIEIQQLDEMVIGIIQTNASCFGANDGQAGVNLVMGGDGTPLDQLQYNWSNNETSSSISQLEEGQFFVTVIDQQGCIGTEATFIDAPDSIQIELEGNDPLCFEESTGSASVVNTLNTFGDITYLWDNTTGSQTTPTATNLPEGQYSVSISDENNCIGVASLSISDPLELVTSTSAVANDCSGDASGLATVNITGGTGQIQILWSNGGSDNLITNLTEDWWYVTVTDQNLCAVQDSAYVSSPLPIEVDYTTTDPICFGERNGLIELLPVGGFTPFIYSLDGLLFTSSSTLIGLPADDYTIYIEDDRGCTEEIEVSLEEPSELFPFVVSSLGDTLYNNDEIELNLGDSIILEASVLNAQNPMLYTWSEPYLGTFRYLSPDNATIITNTQNTIYYTVHGQDVNGCYVEMQFRVNVIKDRIIEVPTAFSPNSDNLNDLLLIHGQDGTIINKFQVFDRWGELIYQNIDFPVNLKDIGWDGSFRGKPMPSGTYIWYLEAEYIDKRTETFKGHTTIIR